MSNRDGFNFEPSVSSKSNKSSVSTESCTRSVNTVPCLGTFYQHPNERDYEVHTTPKAAHRYPFVHKNVHPFAVKRRRYFKNDGSNVTTRPNRSYNSHASDRSPPSEESSNQTTESDQPNITDGTSFSENNDSNYLNVFQNLGDAESSETFEPNSTPHFHETDHSASIASSTSSTDLPHTSDTDDDGAPQSVSLDSSTNGEITTLVVNNGVQVAMPTNQSASFNGSTSSKSEATNNTSSSNTSPSYQFVRMNSPGPYQASSRVCHHSDMLEFSADDSVSAKPSDVINAALGDQTGYTKLNADRDRSYSPVNVIRSSSGVYLESDPDDSPTPPGKFSCSPYKKEDYYPPKMQVSAPKTYPAYFEVQEVLVEEPDVHVPLPTPATAEIGGPYLEDEDKLDDVRVIYKGKEVEHKVRQSSTSVSSDSEGAESSVEIFYKDRKVKTIPRGKDSSTSISDSSESEREKNSLSSSTKESYSSIFKFDRIPFSQKEDSGSFKFSRMHSDKLHPLSIMDLVLDETNFTEDVIDAHNLYRKLHGAENLTRNSHLSRLAREYAAQLADSSHKFDKNLSAYLLKNESVDIIGLNVDIGETLTPGKQFVDLWYKERAAFVEQCGENPTKEDIQELAKEVTRFTQVVWKSTSAIGVGRSCRRPGQCILVCYYYPGGNRLNLYDANVQWKLSGN